MQTGLTYADVGCTQPGDAGWPSGPGRREVTVALGSGEDCWSASRTAVMTWQVKTRSGFEVASQSVTPVIDGTDETLSFRFGPLRVREPVRVVAVVDTPLRCGFAYGTRAGHPVSGEEAFIVHRDDADKVWLTVRSLTLPAPGWRRTAFPFFLVAQRLLRRRYLSALR